MALEVRITLRAAAQIEELDRWWQNNRPAAPGAVHADVDAAFALLRVQPGIGTAVTNSRLAGVRRLHLGRIRYHLYYRVKDDALVVLACWHSSRGRNPSL